MLEKQFRKVPKDSIENFKMAFESPVNPLIIVSTDKTSMFLQTPADKYEALRMLNRNIEAYEAKKFMILFAWTGKWRTDVFEITPEDTSLFLPQDVGSEVL